MSIAMVRTLTPADAARAIDVIVLAFAADPMTRWTWPDPQQYLGAMPRLARAFGGRAFELESAFAAGDYYGAALWLPPDVQPDDDALTALMEETVAPAQQEAAVTIFEQMGACHPHEPHWYLPLIGVDPMWQGKGYGDALMTRALELCDRDRLPAYLESTNPRNISLYRRHGFEPLGTIQVAGSPPLTPMLRRAR